MMRERIGSGWPVLSETFGLHPWHCGGPTELTVEEVTFYVDYLNRKIAAQAQQRR
jgi:hypothetical protein